MRKAVTCKSWTEFSFFARDAKGLTLTNPRGNIVLVRSVGKLENYIIALKRREPIGTTNKNLECRNV